LKASNVQFQREYPISTPLLLTTASDLLLN
jgi:hypothetical protein